MELIPEFIFNISPGLEVKNASITQEEISIDESIFSPGQIKIIEKILNAEIEKYETQINQREQDFAETLEKEKMASWQEGNEAGITQTKNELLSVVSQLKEEMEKTLNAFTFQTDTFLDHHEHQILSLITAIARKVIEVEVTLNPEIILTTLRRSLEYLNEKEEIKIMVNPTDWSIVKENLSRFALNIDMPQNIEVVANEDIESGGCRIDFKSGSIDAELETQFTEIKRKLLKSSE